MNLKEICTTDHYLKYNIGLIITVEAKLDRRIYNPEDKDVSEVRTKSQQKKSQECNRLEAKGEDREAMHIIFLR